MFKKTIAILSIAALSVGMVGVNSSHAAKFINQDKQILPNGDFDSALSGWTASGGASSSVVQGIAGNAVRVTGNVSSYMYRNSTFTAGVTYRITGWARGDGGSSRPVLRDVSNGVYFLGTSSNSWQRIDITRTAAHPQMRLYIFGGTGYVEFDEISITVSNGLGVQDAEKQLLADGDMEASGTSAWTVLSSAIVSKDTYAPMSGYQSLKVTYNGTANPGAAQTILTVGKRYKISLRLSGDGVAGRTVQIDDGSQVIATGTSSPTPQYISAIFTAQGTALAFRGISYGAGNYFKIDDVSITEYKGQTNLSNGFVFYEDLYSKNSTLYANGCTEVGSPTINQGMDLSGTTGVGVQCDAKLTALQDLTKGTILARVKIPLSSANYKTLFQVRDAASVTKFEVGLNTGDNKMYWYAGGATILSIAAPSGGSTQYLAWTNDGTNTAFFMGNTLDAIAANGGSASTFGTTNASQHVRIGARMATPANDWKENIEWIKVYPTVLTLNQIKEAAQFERQ